MRNERYVWLIIGFFLCVSSSKGQGLSPIENERAPDRLIYGEALGNGLLYSINYESLRSSIGRWKFGYRAGLGVAPPFISSSLGEDPFFSIPVEFVTVRGKKNNFLSIGVGVTYIKRYPQRGLPHFWSCVGVGYKYIPKNRSIFFKIQPLIMIPIHQGLKDFFFQNLNFSAALGIGYRFNSSMPKSGDCD